MDDFERSIENLVEGPIAQALRALPQGEAKNAIAANIEQLLHLISTERSRLLEKVNTSAAVPEEPHGDAEWQSNRILFVDENRVNQHVAQLLFSDMAFEVCSVNSGEKALAAFKKGYYKLVFLDCQLSDTDSYEVCKAVKKIAKQNGFYVAVIGMTSSSIFSHHSKCIESGMDDCIKKPLDSVELADTARHWLKIGTRIKHSDANLSCAVEGDQLSSTAVLDTETLRHRFRNNGVHEVLRLFLATAPDEIAKIRSFLRVRNFEQAKRQVHSLKGSSATICALRLNGICKQLEGATESEDSLRCDSLLNLLERTLGLTLSEIEVCFSALFRLENKAER